jgi:hypothetical protein
MYLIIYKKSTKQIVNFRSDGSTGETSPTAEYFFNLYLKDSGASAEQAADLTYVEPAFVEFGLEDGKHVWNESTQQVDEDPSYVPPTPPVIPAPAEPTT